MNLGHRSMRTCPGTSRRCSKSATRWSGYVILCTESTSVLLPSQFHFQFDLLCVSSTLTASTGVKTRHFKTIVAEIVSCIRLHAEAGQRLGGVSLEFTGELNDEGFSVTECLGGSMELSEEELGLRYQVRDAELNPSRYWY
jgi:hypothetical protein